MLPFTVTLSVLGSGKLCQVRHFLDAHSHTPRLMIATGGRTPETPLHCEPNMQHATVQAQLCLSCGHSGKVQNCPSSLQ